MKTAEEWTKYFPEFVPGEVNLAWSAGAIRLIQNDALDAAAAICVREAMPHNNGSMDARWQSAMCLSLSEEILGLKVSTEPAAPEDTMLCSCGGHGTYTCTSCGRGICGDHWCDIDGRYHCRKCFDRIVAEREVLGVPIRPNQQGETDA